MGLLHSYSAFLVRHPGKLLTITSLNVILLFALTLWLRSLQSFSDPLVGFEARGTALGSKINTWKLLADETSASANNISLMPNWHLYDGSYSQVNWHQIEPDHDHQSGLELNNETSAEPPIGESSGQHEGRAAQATSVPREEILDEDELNELAQSSNSTAEGHQATLMHHHHTLDGPNPFCGKLYEGYAQAVVSSSARYATLGLFNIDSLRAICELDQRLRLEQAVQESYLFRDVCEQFQNETFAACCNSWSLPNYIACLSNKPTCMEITLKDLRNFEQLLDLCAPHYLRVPLEECFETAHTPAPANARQRMDFYNLAGNDPRAQCGAIPSECLRCGGWTFNVLHYLTSDYFLRHRSQPPAETVDRTRLQQSRLNVIGSPREINVNKLTHTNIFLPMAKSGSLMRYYLALAKHSLKSPHAQVKSLNLGLKNSLFEHLISHDMRLFAIALAAILLVISIYTWSFILSLVILLIICLSLCLSYTIYELVLNIAIFPFMNLLAVVISFGICSDNAMLFCKHWSLSKEQLALEHQRKGGATQASQVDPQARTNHASLDLMLRKAVLSTSAATLATACSFVISAISQVTAVRCFCIFATLAVITNYLLIILLLPPALVLDARLQDFLANFLANQDARVGEFLNQVRAIRGKFLEFGERIHMDLIFTSITRFKFYLIITFLTLLICASILVFHGPALQPADEEIPLLSKKHAFEQYNRNLRRQFPFERAKQGDVVEMNSNSNNNNNNNKLIQEEPIETLPIRIVFGLKPEDNGDHLDPQDRGGLVFDSAFDIADPDAQIWLLDFCQKLRGQQFVHSAGLSEVSNCFMDMFKSWLETRKCKDPIDQDVDRSPCCETHELPLGRHAFNKCMLEAVRIMRRTPHLYPNINGGIRFHKNSTRVAALIVEYQSNRIYTDSFLKMERFYTEINDWVNWHINNTAPASMRSGWFISNNLDLLALQTELEQSTNVSVLLEALFATLALLISTRDLFLTLAGTLTICTIIIVILATLILLKWTLGVAESILISLTIGLSIDFALHYSVAYSEGVRSRPNHGLIQRLLNEVGGPVALATTTTTLAGFVIVWSDILAYQELGTFLMLIAVVSWLSSTLFLLPMLATFDSIRELSEQYARMLLLRAQKMLIDRL